MYRAFGDMYACARPRGLPRMLLMFSRRLTHFLWPTVSTKVPHYIQNLLGCHKQGSNCVSISKTMVRPISQANCSSTPSSTLYRRTRLMMQYEKIKEQYKDYILLFQVGDFYEIYGEDASKIINFATHACTGTCGVSIV